MPDQLHDACERIVESLELRAIGYDVTIDLQREPRVEIALTHPLRGNMSSGFGADSSKQDWIARLEQMIGAWPDLAVARAGAALSGDAVLLLGSLRHTELRERLRLRKRPAELDAAMTAIFMVAVTLRGMVGLLDDAAIDWLERPLPQTRSSFRQWKFNQTGDLSNHQPAFEGTPGCQRDSASTSRIASTTTGSSKLSTRSTSIEACR